MTSWKAYILFATILPLVKTENNQRGHKLETTTIPNPQQPFGQKEMSEEHKIKVGNRIEPVIFEPQQKIKLSRSTYKVTSYVDFKPYKQSFKQFGQYIDKLLVDLQDPHYVSTLCNIERQEGDPFVRRGTGVKTFFSTAPCKQTTYKCRLQNQFIQLKREATKINQIYLETYKKFLRAIDHMEFHPTLGRAKRRSTIRLKRQPKGKDKTIKASQYINQKEGLTKEDKLMLRQADELIETKFLNKTTKKRRNKRFGLAGWIMGWGIGHFTSFRAIKDNIRTLQLQNKLQEDQILELSHYLNITYAHVSTNRYAITNLQVQLAQLNKTLIATMQDVKFIRYTVAVITDVRIILAKLTLGVIGLQQNVNAIYEYLRVLSSKQVNPLIIPPDALRGVLARIKEDMKRNSRLQLPEDPNINIWNYYPIMKITPVVMDDFLLIILTIPLTDQSLEMNLYKGYNLPALHPELKVEFTYELEGEYLAITKNKLYAALPTAREIRICKGTGGYLCLMNQALYPIERIEWCIYALFTHNEEKKKEYCSINTHRRDANKAQSLEGYLWTITAFKKGKMQIRCLTDTHVINIKPPLTIIYVGDGCEAYSNNLFIPAKSELTSTDSSLVRHNYFQRFNEEYQDITRYSLIEDLGIVQLTSKEIANIPDRLMALPKLQFKELKRRLVEIKQPLNIHSNVSFILVMIGGLILCPIIAYVLWRIYRVRSNVKRFKPVIKTFNDKKGDLFNISDLVSNRLRTLEASFSSLIGPVAPNTSTRTELALPSTSARPTLPPRSDSIPMLDINISPQIIQETVKDMEKQGSKVIRYQKYLQKQASEDQE